MASETGPVEFLFDTELSLVAGQQYVAFLSVSDLPAQGSLFHMPGALAPLDGGSFVYDNNGTNFAALTTGAWDCTSCDRSEEHTSELQSLMRISYAVFCLTKKKPST